MAQKYGYMANAEKVEASPCLVCDDPTPAYSWTDYNGEGYCVKCGTPYQLKNGTLEEGQTYPRCNISEKWIPRMREFWQEKKVPNGTGTFLLPQDYPDQMRGRITFNEWRKARGFTE